jgi:hypothetical protein
MSGGVRFTHVDDDPLFTGTHDGPDNASYLQSIGAMFKTLGAIPGLYIENVTQNQHSTIRYSTDKWVVAADSDAGFPYEFPFEMTGYGGGFPYTFPFTFGPVQWDHGDVYKIYKTGTKGSVISQSWTDVSKGWQSPKDELVEGWFAEDVDLDDHGREHVFGPNQPE